MKRLFAVAALLAAIVPAALFAQSAGGSAEGAPEMTHRITVLVLQLALVIIVARFLGHFFKHYLRQAAVLGELAAGIVIGPYALGAIPLPILNGPLFPLELGPIPVRPELYGFAVVASIVLLFVAGLETDLPTFLRFSIKGSAIGLGGVVVSFILGDAAAVLLLPAVDSFMHPAALFLGTVSTATSVGITARILEERHKLSSPEGVTILAAAVIDDVLGIILLAVVVGVSKVHSLGSGVEWGHIGIIAAKAFGFWIVSTVLGIIFAPKLAKGLRKFKTFEVTASVAFGIALFLAGLSEEAGLAMIIGAYVTGLSLSQTELANELQEYLQPLYDFFVPIFFCVMGMMANLAEMGSVLVFGIAFTLLAIVAKLVGCGVPALFTGFSARGALRIGAGMLPRGEVTLIVAGIGLASGAIGHDMFGVAVMTLLVASVIAPPALIKAFEGGSGLRGAPAPEKKEPERKDIVLSFSTPRISEFIRGQFIRSFRKEEFFVHQLELHQPFYQIWKDEILITLHQQGSTIVLQTEAQYEQFVRLLVLEEILELKDFLATIEGEESPDSLSRELFPRAGHDTLVGEGKVDKTDDQEEGPPQ